MDKLWVYILCPIWSFIINCLYWLFHPHKYWATKKIIKIHKNKIKSRSDIKKSLLKVKCVSGNFKNWKPWVITFVARGLKDDCDGTAIFGKFVFKCAGIDSNIWHLRDKKTGQAICVTKDESYMIMNNQLIKLDGMSPLKYFDGIYDRAI
jgi:hypothetical protein